MCARKSEPSDHDRRAEQFLRDLNALFVESRDGAGLKFLQHVLDAGVQAVGGKRGFLAIVHHETGELEVCATSGEGWTDRFRPTHLNLATETSRGITGHVALQRQPYMTGDVDRDPYYLRYFDDVKSEMAVPILTAGGLTYGVINVASPKPDAFHADDLAHLTALAHAAAAGVGMLGFRQRESALINISKTLAATLDVGSLMNRVVDLAAEALQFEDCSAFLLDEQTDHLILRAAHGTLADHVGKAAYQVEEGLIGWVAQHGEPIRLEEPTADPRWLDRFNALPTEEIGAFLAVPIVSRDRIVGVLRVLRRKRHAPWFSNRFTEVDERVLMTIASQLGAAVDNARSHQRLVRAERMAAWGELSARSAHMIGNRAFALKGDLNELNYLLMTLPASEQRRELIALAESMERGIERLEEILREFRDFVVATQVDMAQADINVLLREAVVESFPRRSNVRLTLQLADGIPTLTCDAKKLKRAFSELIENAISFQPDGGEMRIASRLLDPQERARQRLARTLEYVELEFADRGPGVPEELKERIFRPLFTSRNKGMGLGLSIVKDIVEAHHGLMRETGAPGDGARFLIFLPLN